MNIFLFEYAVSSGDKEINDNIFEEGYLMYKTLLNDFINNNHTVYTIISENNYYNKVINNFKNSNINLNNIDNLKITILKNNENYNLKIKELLKNNKNINCGLIIAPECDNILYNLTKTLEKYNILNLGCFSEGIKIAGDKYLTYLKIKNVVNTPKTIKPDNYIVKDICGCGGEHEIINNNKIIQEYINGENYSFSFIVNNTNNKIYPLCLNKQYINKCYCGGETNINHNLKEKIIIQCKKALKEINGLNGYVGVDIIITENNEIYILEINPRITTSVVGINTTPSLGSLLIDNIVNDNNKNNKNNKNKNNDLKYTINKGIKFRRNNGSFEFF